MLNQFARLSMLRYLLYKVLWKQIRENPLLPELDHKYKTNLNRRSYRPTWRHWARISCSSTKVMETLPPPSSMIDPNLHAINRAWDEGHSTKRCSSLVDRPFPLLWFHCGLKWVHRRIDLVRATTRIQWVQPSTYSGQARTLSVHGIYVNSKSSVSYP